MYPVQDYANSPNNVSSTPWLPGFLKSGVDKGPPWEDIFNRKEELRDDLKRAIGLLDVDELKEKYIPLYDPFSLTLTWTITYDTWDNAKLSHDIYVVEIVNTLLKFNEQVVQTENTISHAYYNVDGDTVTYIEDWESLISS